MKLFRSASVNGKLTLLTMSIAGFTLFVACTVFVLYAYYASRNETREHLTNLTEVVGTTLAAPLVFEDSAFASQVLEVFEDVPSVTKAVVYSPDGEPLAEFRRGAPDRAEEHSTDMLGREVNVHVYRPVLHGGRVVGNIYVAAEQHDLYTRVKTLIGISLIFLVIAPFLALALTARLKRLVSNPIVNLADTARMVSTDEDFSLRAQGDSNDEVGILIRSFNSMLDQIQKRDDHLQQASEELEDYAKKLEMELLEHRRTSEELQMFQSLANASALGFGVADLDGNVLYDNPALARMLGYGPGEAPRGISIERYFTQEWIQRLNNEVIPGALNDGQWTGEAILLRVDGGQLPVFQNVFVIKNDRGEPRYLAGVFTDIRELKEAQEQLRKSEERLRNAQKVAHVGNWELDIATRKIWGSEEAFRIYGLRRVTSDLPHDQTEALVLPEDREKKTAALQAVISGTGPYDVDYRIKRANDGVERFIHSKAELVCDEHGRPLRVEGIVQDVTERRIAMEELYHSRQMLQLVLNNVPQRVFWKARDLTYLGCNKQFAQDAGLDDPLDIIGKDDYELSWKASAHAYRADDEQVMSADVAKISFEEMQVRDDGSELWLRTSKIPLHDRNQQVIGVLGTYEDITRQKAAEEQRKQLQEKLERAQRMESLGILAGGVAHDLNNMLGPLVGYPELILRKLPEDSPIRKQVMRIGRSAQEAADVIQDLLTLARRGRYEMVPTNLNDIVDEFLESPTFLRTQERHPDIDVNLNLDRNLGSILGSASHLSKVVMNLIINACDAMPGGGTLTIESSQRYLTELEGGHDKVVNGDYAVLRVADTGMGIDPADLEKIFEPYYSKKKMGRSGSGLGLSVVYGIVKDHKAYYDIVSEKDKGTEFILYFPITEADNEEEQAEELHIEGNEVILVVDDVQEQREVAIDMLSSLGYEVHEATGGSEAINMIDGRAYDLVVLDMIMEKDLDGLDTYRALLKKRPGLKAVIVSGYSATDRVNETLKLGAGQYVRKPYTLETIGKAVRMVLNGQTDEAGVPTADATAQA